MRIIDYDAIETWAPWFDEIMSDIAPPDLCDTLRSSKPKYLEDARKAAVRAVGREQLVQALGEALNGYRVRVYHGTRVSTDDASSIRAVGLRPLLLADRRNGLLNVLTRHPRWSDVSSRFDDVLLAYGAGEKAGAREDDRIHFCFSREALVRGCDHYLCYGAEVDAHITHDLFGDDSANALFVEFRKPLIISWVAPYADGEKAANPFGWDSDGLPSFMSSLIAAWAYQKAHPDFSVRRERDDVAGWFHGGISVTAIERIEELTDAELNCNTRGD